MVRYICGDCENVNDDLHNEEGLENVCQTCKSENVMIIEED